MCVLASLNCTNINTRHEYCLIRNSCQWDTTKTKRLWIIKPILTIWRCGTQCITMVCTQWLYMEVIGLQIYICSTHASIILPVSNFLFLGLTFLLAAKSFKVHGSHGGDGFLLDGSLVHQCWHGNRCRHLLPQSWGVVCTWVSPRGGGGGGALEYRQLHTRDNIL